MKTPILSLRLSLEDGNAPPPDGLSILSFENQELNISHYNCCLQFDPTLKGAYAHVQNYHYDRCRNHFESATRLYVVVALLMFPDAP